MRVSKLSRGGLKPFWRGLSPLLPPPGSATGVMVSVLFLSTLLILNLENEIYEKKFATSPSVYLQNPHTRKKERERNKNMGVDGWVRDSRTFFSSFSFYNTSEEYDFFICCSSLVLFELNLSKLLSKYLYVLLYLYCSYILLVNRHC
jgi:hypothetical protein